MARTWGGGSTVKTHTPDELSRCLNAGGMGRLDFETETLIPVTGGSFSSDVAPGTDIGNAGDPAPTIGGSHIPAIAIQERAVSENMNAGPQGKGWQEGIAYTLEARNKVQAVANGWAVRRLTPIECARLMGFPDDWCFIPVRKVKAKRVEKAKDKSRFRLIDGEWWEMAADGPQYKAYGNSIVTKVMTWIGTRIDTVEALTRKAVPLA